MKVILLWSAFRGQWWKSPSHTKYNLCSCRILHENGWWSITFRLISDHNTNLNFQGCHISANLVNSRLNGNPDQKNNLRFCIFMAKLYEIWNLYFRVPRKGMSGLPYLRRGHQDCQKNYHYIIYIKNDYVWSKHFTWELKTRNKSAVRTFVSKKPPNIRIRQRSTEAAFFRLGRSLSLGLSIYLSLGRIRKLPLLPKLR